jgi:RimJ/RimL family protein N-acetyltransferase
MVSRWAQASTGEHRRVARVTVFSTPRLVVRAWTHSSSDLERIYDTYSRWEVVQWLGAVPTALDSCEQGPNVVDRWAACADDQAGFGIWAAQVRDTGVVAGTVLLVPLPAPEGEAPDGDGGGGGTEVEVGWHLHPDSWGFGYATEAAQGAIEHGFAHALAQIHAVVRPGNEPSLAVCRRLGMTPLGRTSRWYGLELEAFRIDRASVPSASGRE